MVVVADAHCHKSQCWSSAESSAQDGVCDAILHLDLVGYIVCSATGHTSQYSSAHTDSPKMGFVRHVRAFSVTSLSA